MVTIGGTQRLAAGVRTGNRAGGFRDVRGAGVGSGAVIDRGVLAPTFL